MKRVLVLFLIILFIVLGLSYRFFLPSSDLFSPYVSSESVIDLKTESAFPVSCVLTYGTFLVSQEDCDELTNAEASTSADSSASQCIVSEGTFLVGERECAILKKSQGSRDVLEKLGD